MNNSLVSVITTTKNEEKNIRACLESIKKQTYKPLEIIVVDNHSTDKTKEIAKKYTTTVFDKGPERSAQRNFGAKKALGKYVLFLDADMVLATSVVSDCISEIQNKGVGGIIIPEESYGKGIWAQVKKLERSFYVGNDLVEAARFFDKEKFLSLGGFDENITGPEDWDLSQRVKDKYHIERVHSFIYHNEGRLTFLGSVRKKYYYSKKFSTYAQKSINMKYSTQQMNLFKRYHIFLSNPLKLFKNPLLGLGVLALKTSEFCAGGIGYIIGSRKR
jgi:glycosyltransferase involved in cell wall biosynthesis